MPSVAGTLDLSQFSNPNVLNTFQSALSVVPPTVQVPDPVGVAQAAYGMLPASAQNAVGDVIDSYNNIPANIRQMGGDLIAGAMQGNVPISSVMPLVSLGLAATGVGAPVAGLVAAAVPIFEGVGQALHLFGQPQHSDVKCTWIVRGTANPSPDDLSGGDMTMPLSDDDMRKHGYTPESFGCFNKKRPYGPTDPSWVKFSDYVKKNQKRQANGNVLALEAFPDWTWLTGGMADAANAGNAHYTKKTDDGRVWKKVPYGTTARFDPSHGVFEMNASALYTAPLAVRQFAALYFYMWQANAERAINGHKYASDADILSAAVQAWHTHHEGGPTVTISPGRGWFVEALLNGDIDGQDKPAFTLPTGLKPKPKKVLAFHLGKAGPLPSKPDVAVTAEAARAAQPPTAATPPGAPAPSKRSLLLPYVPAVVGVVLTPVAGFVAPVVGIAASFLWKELRKTL